MQVPTLVLRGPFSVKRSFSHYNMFKRPKIGSTEGVMNIKHKKVMATTWVCCFQAQFPWCLWYIIIWSCGYPQQAEVKWSSKRKRMRWKNMNSLVDRRLLCGELTRVNCLKSLSAGLKRKEKGCSLWGISCQWSSMYRESILSATEVVAMKFIE